MSVSTSQSISTSGLVFNMDPSSIQSYKGPPLQNILTQITPRGQGSSAFYNFSSGSEQVNIPTVGLINCAYMDMYNDYNGGSGNCCPSPYGYGDSLTVTGSTVYTYAILYKSVNRYTHPNFMYHYEYNGATYLTEYGVHMVGGYSGQETHLGNDWYWSRAKFTTNASCNLIYTGSWMYEYAKYNRFYVAKAMIVAGDYTSLHPSLWPTVGTTRSNTQSFADLTKRTSMTATSLTYASDGSFSFNGSSDSIDLGKTCTDLGLATAATFDVWIYPTTSSAMYGISDYGTNGIGMTLRTNSNASADFYIYPNNYRITYTYAFNANQWYNLVGVASGSTMYMYLNGQQVASTALGNAIGTSSNSLKIGSRGDGPSVAAGTGKCGPIKIYNRALSATEILQNFNAYRSRYGL
jgi:hypothetical protein